MGLLVFSEGRIVYRHGQQMKRNMEELDIADITPVEFITST